MLCFDIGANRGDFTLAALNKGYQVIALEPAPRVFAQLVKNFIYNPNVMPLRYAVSDSDFSRVDFYEANEDGLSTLNKDWLTDKSMPYAGKDFRTITATTITLDLLSLKFGVPDLIKIDVEGAEWSVFNGMSKKMGTLSFEWTYETIDEHNLQIAYLASLGYTQVGPQFIEHHCQEPKDWFPLEGFDLAAWLNNNKKGWVKTGWKISGLRPTADVGMVWVR
jgi:FkbM family methyltransferase